MLETAREEQFLSSEGVLGRGRRFPLSWPLPSGSHLTKRW
jgi:hypothetical protein